jgi:hypothetical protein
MSPEFVRNTVARRPFRAFIMHLAGGRTIPVRSPEFIDVPAEGRLVIVENLSGSTHIVDLLLVTDIEFPHTPMV